MNTQKLHQNHLDLEKSRRIKFTLKQKKYNPLIIMSVICMMIVSNSIFAQDIAAESIITTDLDNPIIETNRVFIQVKGIVSDEEGPLPGVSIILKGTTTGTASNFKGEFTFPKELNPGDVLMFSYLGFKKEEIIIKEDTSFITLTMVMDDIDILEALPIEKPYKSKRNKSKRRSN